MIARKKGIIARISTRFMPFMMNLHFLGLTRSLRKYSKVKKMAQLWSMMLMAKVMLGCFDTPVTGSTCFGENPNLIIYPSTITNLVT